ncbi:MAG: energy transducer TonB [Bacteroidetes bacterium]|nr:energy transducer TonB [Bacteroidota bacterium]
MKKFFSLFCLLFSSYCFSQSSSSSDKQNMTVTSSQEAHYPKGEQELYNYVLYNTKYSEEAKKKYIEGTVELSFDVMPDSTIKNIKILSDVGSGVGNEVKKLLEKLKFAPGVTMGVKVKSNLIMDFPVKAH